MKMKKLIASLLCALMCLAMLPAQASATESVFLSDVGVTITLPESWYLGARQDGAASELAQALALDQNSFDSLFTDGLYMIACPDTSATTQLQIIVKDDDSVDMRTMTETEKQEIVEGGWSAEASGIDVLTCEIYATPYTNYMKTHYQYSGFTAVQYATVFGGKMYMYQYCDYTGNAVSAETIAELDAIVDAVVYGAEDSSQTQASASPFSIPTVNVISTPTGMEEIYVPDIGMTISVPTEWYTGLYIEGADSELAVAFELTEEDIESMYNSGGYKTSFFATPDLNGIAQLQIISTPGISIDMRDSDLDWDSLMAGFLSTYDAGSIIESGKYEGGASNYVRVYTKLSGTFPMLQYITNIDGTIYIIQYFDYGIENFDADTISLIDSIVYNVTFD